MNGTQFALRDTQYVIRPAVYCFLLSAFFALSLSQLTSTSPTFDEGFTLLRGYAALRTGHLVPLGHPPLAHWLSATGVLLDPYEVIFQLALTPAVTKVGSVVPVVSDATLK